MIRRSLHMPGIHACTNEWMAPLLLCSEVTATTTCHTLKRHLLSMSLPSRWQALKPHCLGWDPGSTTNGCVTLDKVLGLSFLIYKIRLIIVPPSSRKLRHLTEVIKQCQTHNKCSIKVSNDYIQGRSKKEFLSLSRTGILGWIIVETILCM